MYKGRYESFVIHNVYWKEQNETCDSNYYKLERASKVS